MNSQIIAQISFGQWPESPGEKWQEDFDTAFGRFISNLPRCGQMIGESVHGVVAGRFVAFLQLPHPDSLNPRYFSKYAREDLATLQTLLNAETHFQILAPGDNKAQISSWQTARWLVLYGSSTDGIAPVRDEALNCIPSYLLPMDADDQEQLCFWARNQERHLGIWFASGSLETEAFTALADPESALNVKAAELARRVEEATGKPTYIDIFRHYSLPANEEDARKCPLCGAEWRVSDERFDFRCDPCRIVSHLAVTEDENDLSKIGAWKAPVH